MIPRAVVSVGFGERCEGGLRRLHARLDALGVPVVSWLGSAPDGAPPHADCPYGFKLTALERAAESASTLLWLDSTVIVLRPLDDLFAKIEADGYWISANHGLMNGEFTADGAYPALGVGRAENWKIPHVVATCFGLDMSSPVGARILESWTELRDAGAFAGPRSNERGEASGDPAVRGHRHDQTALSVVAYKMGLALTNPPDWFADEGYEGSDATVLTNRRC